MLRPFDFLFIPSGIVKGEKIVRCRKLSRKNLELVSQQTSRCVSLGLTTLTKCDCSAKSRFPSNILYHGEKWIFAGCHVAPLTPLFFLVCRYEDITSNSTRFYSLAAVYNCAIVGLLVAEIKSWHKLNKEDRTILSESLGRNSSLAYILSLGVHRKWEWSWQSVYNIPLHSPLIQFASLFRYRRNGIATLLLRTFIEHLQGSEQNSKIKAIYLHVLTTNQPAILFYERYKWVNIDAIGSSLIVLLLQLHPAFILALLLQYQGEVEGRILICLLHQRWP